MYCQHYIFQPPDENEAFNYDKVVIPKDDETRRALEAVMCKNILFSHLEVIFHLLNFWKRDFLLLLFYFRINPVLLRDRASCKRFC